MKKGANSEKALNKNALSEALISIDKVLSAAAALELLIRQRQVDTGAQAALICLNKVSYSFRNFVRDKVSSISHKLGFWPIFCARGNSKNRTIAPIVRDSWALISLFASLWKQQAWPCQVLCLPGVVSLQICAFHLLYFRKLLTYLLTYFNHASTMEIGQHMQTYNSNRM